MFHLLNNCTIHSPSSVTTILYTVVVKALIEYFTTCHKVSGIVTYQCTTLGGYDYVLYTSIQYQVW